MSDETVDWDWKEHAAPTDAAYLKRARREWGEDGTRYEHLVVYDDEGEEVGAAEVPANARRAMVDDSDRLGTESEETPRVFSVSLDEDEQITELESGEAVVNSFHRTDPSGELVDHLDATGPETPATAVRDETVENDTGVDH